MCQYTTSVQSPNRTPNMITIVRVQAQKKAATGNLSNLEFVLSDAETAEFPEGTFDRLLCSSGMLYLQHIGAAVHRFHSWLKPGGEVHFNTPQVGLHCKPH